MIGMVAPVPLPTFSKAAVAAFPFAWKRLAERAAEALSTSVDDSYRRSPIIMAVLGNTVRIPSRIHFLKWDEARCAQSEARLAIQCLWTRSTDGHLRQAALRGIAASSEPAVIPFVAMLAGEYIVEIINDLTAALPALDRDAYANFVRENRSAIKNLRAKATSYWDCYYRADYPDRAKYPGLMFLHEIERWAA